MVMENADYGQSLDYNEDYRKCERVEAPLTRIKQYLGDYDADKEWGDNSQDAYKRFSDLKWEICIKKLIR